MRQFHRFGHISIEAGIESVLYGEKSDAPVFNAAKYITDQTIARIRIARELPMTTILKKKDSLLIHEIRFVITECFLRT